jgi:hypothetical protein
MDIPELKPHPVVKILAMDRLIAKGKYNGGKP